MKVTGFYLETSSSMGGSRLRGLSTVYSVLIAITAVRNTLGGFCHSDGGKALNCTIMAISRARGRAPG